MAEEKKKKSWVKWVVIVVVVAIVVILLWMLFKGGKAIEWTEHVNKDVTPGINMDGSGQQYTVDDAKKKAVELGAKSFFRSEAGYVWFKSADQPLVNSASNGTLYVIKSNA